MGGGWGDAIRALGSHSRVERPRGLHHSDADD